MKKLLLTLVTAGLVTVSARATTYTDFNSDFVYFGSSGPSSYTNVFNILDYGYNPSEPITSATANFLFLDTVGGEESLTLNLAGSQLSSTGSFLGWIEVGGDVVGNALFDLSADGIVSYTITRTDGEFFLAGATLVARTPDGGATLLLLGMSFLGILAFQRKSAPSR